MRATTLAPCLTQIHPFPRRTATKNPSSVQQPFRSVFAHRVSQMLKTRSIMSTAWYHTLAHTLAQTLAQTLARTLAWLVLAGAAGATAAGFAAADCSAQDRPRLSTNEAYVEEASRATELKISDPLAIFAFMHESLT